MTTIDVILDYVVRILEIFFNDGDPDILLNPEMYWEAEKQRIGS